jgi:hypothetical protein
VLTDVFQQLNLYRIKMPKNIIFFWTIYRLTVLLEEKVDLEAIHDINEEMQENARRVDYSIYPLSLGNVVGYGSYPQSQSRSVYDPN